MPVRIEAIPQVRIPHVWDDLRQSLDRAMKRGNRSPETVFKALMKGQMRALCVTGDGVEGHVVIEGQRPPGTLGTTEFWITFAAGECNGGPKRNMASMQAVVSRLEDMARRGKCTAICVQGRNWSRVLTGYETERCGNEFYYRKAL